MMGGVHGWARTIGAATMLAFAGVPLFAQGAAPSGARSLTIVVPEPGDHFVRFLPSPETKKPAELPIEFRDKKTVVEIPERLGRTPRVAVDDVRTGNTAIVPIPAAGGLELRRSDFDHVHRMEVRVTYEGKPLKTARVTLTPVDKQAREKLIDAASQGAAVFEDVPAGKATLKIIYGDNHTETKDVVISTDRESALLVINAPVTNRAPTLESAGTEQPPAAPAGPAAPGIQPAPPPPAGGGGIPALVGTLLALAVGGGGIYLLYRWAQSGGMAATLKKAGIEVSGPAPPSDAGTPWAPNAPPPPVVSDPSLCPFCGQKRDAGGGCACAITGAALSAGAGSVGVPVQPRLVGTVGEYSGTVFPLQLNGSGITIGREPTNAVALANDTTVSRRHASIRGESGTYVITDEGSSNGVYVNGVRISGSQPLNPGDEVQIGNTRFRFEV